MSSVNGVKSVKSDPIVRRQELPDEAFWPAGDAVRLWGKKGTYYTKRVSRGGGLKRKGGVK